MDWGIENRPGRILRAETGRTVMLAIDHGYFLGPLTRLEKPGETVEPLLAHADALMLARGVLRNCIPPAVDKAMVLRVSGGRSILCREELPDEGLATSMEDAVRLNASAVAISIFVGTKYEKESILNLAKLVDQGEQYGIPVLAVTAVGEELDKRTSRYLALACRMAAEFGAHFVKTYFCDEFEKVADSCPVPLVIAGGPKLDTEMDAFKMVRDALDRGAVGVDMGRNIWQNDNAVAMIRAVRGIVHERMSPEAAYEIFEAQRSE
ncbi:MAG: 3-hydroxy-5-phosphonooxypentane-2,4-dione thiolase [Planctomycetota bacterium]|jgi:putative autoinducer-2 (AI-2) aldolase